MERVRLATRIGYAIAGLGAGAVAVPVQLFAMIYLTDTIGVTPAIAGLILASPKLWDLIIDAPLGGLAGQYTRKRGGQWPLLMLGTLGLPFGLVTIFAAWLLNSPMLAAAAVAVGLLVFSTLTTIYMVGHTALADDMTPDPALRTALFGGRSVATCVGGISASIAAPQLVAAGGGHGSGYLGMALSIGAIGLAFLLASYFATRRIPLRVTGNVEDKPPLLRSIGGALRNRPFCTLVGVLILQGLTNGQLSLMLPYVNEQIVHGGPNLLSGVFAAMLGALVIGIPAMSWLAARVGVTRALSIATCVNLAGAAGFYFATFISPAAMIAAAAVTGFASGAYALLIQSAVIDAAKTPVAGAFIPLGIYLGLLFAGEKLGASLAGVMSGIVLEIVGLHPGEPLGGASLELFRAWFGLAPVVFLMGILALLHLSARHAAADQPAPLSPA